MKDYSDYRISDLISDLKDDAVVLKSKLELFDRLRRFFGVFSIVWGYVSIVMFTVYGVLHLIRTGDVVLSAITFSVCGVFLVVNTILLVLRGKSKESRKRYATAKRLFRLVSALLKIAMTAITITSLVGIADDPSIAFRTTWCVLTSFWLGMTVAVDVASFIVRRVLKMLKELAEDRVLRAKSAFTNTANDVATIAKTVKDIGMGVKNIFSKKKEKENFVNHDKSDETDDEFFG